MEYFDKPTVSMEMSIDKKDRTLFLYAEIDTKSIVKVLEWIKNDTLLKMNDRRKYEESGTNTPQLKIFNIGKEDEGNYRLSVRTANCTVSSNCVKFSVQEASPSISIGTEFDDNHQRGIIIVDIDTEWPIECVHWLYNGKRINLADVGKKFKEERCFLKESQRKLYINNFGRQDEGLYSCEVETLAGKGKSSSILIKVPRVVPSVSLSLTFNEKNRSLFLCAEVLSNLPTKAPKWIHNGKQILFNKQPEKYLESCHLPTKPSLKIFDVGKTDEGMYKVSVENECGPGISELQIFKIPKDPPKISLSFINDIQHKSFTVMAEIDSNWPILIAKWQKNKADLVLFGNVSEQVSASTHRNLLIKNYKASDVGRYKLIAESVAGRGESSEIELKIPKVLPEVAMEMSVMKKEEKLKFLATINSKSPIKHVRWLRNDKFIDDTRLCKYWIENTGNDYTLYVNNVTPDDEGTYRVIAENRAGTNSSRTINFQLSNETPKVSLSQTKTEGKHYVEFCGKIESSWPIKKIIWQKDGNDLPKLPGKYDITETKLKVNKVAKQDEGFYRLLVQSTAGVGKSIHIHLSMEPVPERNTDNRNEHPNTFRNKVSTKAIANVDEGISQAMQSSLEQIHRPYNKRVRCEICNKTAIATFQTCADSYCLECLQCLAGTCKTPIVKCPKTGGCSSFITVDTFSRFLKIPHKLNLEMPLYFEVSLGKCTVPSCRNEGVIKMTECFHSLCVLCLMKCSKMTKCLGFACINKEIPPQRYFQYMESALEDKKQPPFLLDVKQFYSGDPQPENIKCSTCIEKANFEIIRCTHKFCDRCYEIIQGFYGVPFLIRKCAVNGCHELYPFPKEQTKPSKNVDQSIETLYEREKANKKSEVPDQKRNTNEVIPVFGSPFYGTSKGLCNIAFSCYRNSILQILAETRRFYECLLEMCDEKDESWICLMKEILMCIRNQRTGGTGMLEILRHFHHKFNVANTAYREYQQEDTLSFLMTVLNGINDEYEKSGKEKKQMKNPLNIFKGQMLDKFCCKDCRKEESFSESNFLSLPLLKESKIEESLLRFLQEEDIEIFPCSKCGSTRVSKRIEICSYPDVLVLQLNKPSNSTGISTRNVIFHETLKDSQNTDLSKRIKKEDIDSYKLYGVVVHRGSDNSGHYICYVRRRNTSTFDKCDDSYVAPARVQDVLKSDAYLLFYEKCDSAV